MKTVLFYIQALLLVMVFAACDDKFETSDNGCLDGFWLLSEVDTLQNGKSENVRQQMLFWAVQGDLLQLSVKKRYTGYTEGLPPTVCYHFNYSNNMLKFVCDEQSPVVGSRYLSDFFAEVPDVRPYGLSRLDEQFSVLAINGNKMILQSETLRLHFDKY